MLQESRLLLPKPPNQPKEVSVWIHSAQYNEHAQFEIIYYHAFFFKAAVDLISQMLWIQVRPDMSILAQHRHCWHCAVPAIVFVLILSQIVLIPES